MMTMLQAAGSPIMTFGFLILIFVVFYFFMIRPQMKRQKELRKFQEALSKGDRVIVSGGIHGKIAEVRDTDVMVEIAPNVVICVAKGSVFADVTTASGR